MNLAIKVSWLFTDLLAPVFLVLHLMISAHAEPWNTPYEKFFTQSGVEAEFETLSDGTEIRTLMLPGKVLLEQRRKNGEISTLTLDQSGLGAVLCSKEIYLAAKMAVDTCRDLENARVSGLLDTAINRINEFIAINSVEQISLNSLVEADLAKLSRFRKQLGASPDDGQVASCKTLNPERAYFAMQIAKSIEKMSDEEFSHDVDELLSVPRLPVMNPCL